jgi:CRP-like cAMP-binding protein
MLAGDQISGRSGDRLGRMTGEPVPNLVGGTSNGLLLQLSGACREEILARATRVPLSRRQVLLERNVGQRFVYFIESGVASIFAKAGPDCANVEIRTLGAGDFVGIPLVLGAQLSPHRCTVQVAGDALRLTAGDFAALVDGFPELRRVLLSYVHVALIYSSQLIACNTRHGLSARLARWLLFASDRLQSDDIALTHDAVGRAIAVRRAGITTEMGRMEQAGLIQRHRGRVSIVDREGLEKVSCSCYRVLRGCCANEPERNPFAPGPQASGRVSGKSASPPTKRQRVLQCAG